MITFKMKNHKNHLKIFLRDSYECQQRHKLGFSFNEAITNNMGRHSQNFV
jgi:hypothetical protein